MAAEEPTPPFVPLPWMERGDDVVRNWIPAEEHAAPSEPVTLSLGSAVPELRSPGSPDPGDDEQTDASEEDTEALLERSALVERNNPATPGPSDPALQLRVDELEHELDELRDRYARSVDELSRAGFELSLRVERDVVRLARKLAEIVVRRVVGLDTEVIMSSLRAAFEVSGPLEKVTVRCAPGDVAKLRGAAEEVAQDKMGRWVEVAVQPSADIEPGGVLLLFEEGIVDARLPSQLDRLTAVVERAIGAQAYAADEGGGGADDTPGDGLEPS